MPADNMLKTERVRTESEYALTAVRETAILHPATYAHLPVFFESNRGQFDPRVRFASRSNGMNVFLTDSDAVLVVKSTADGKLRAARSVVLTVVNEKTSPRVTGLDELPGKVNYFKGNSPQHWQTNVPIFKKVEYADVYPGIDLLFRGNKQQLEFDFILEPGAEPSRIALAVKGADTLNINASGDAVVGLGEDTLLLRKPRIYQQVGAKTRDIPGAFRKDSDGNLRFHVAAYDRSLPLVIDPIVSYSTYLGGGRW